MIIIIIRLGNVSRTGEKKNEKPKKTPFGTHKSSRFGKSADVIEFNENAPDLTYSDSASVINRYASPERRAADTTFPRKRAVGMFEDPQSIRVSSRHGGPV